ncbi:MAG TPA: S16 family serine protease, partial [Kofleriaceae bacterium]|nr:S16 family serine protease [Kofleriaceae bacterium]
MGKRLALALLTFTLSCGGSQAPKQQPTSNAQKDYQPFTIKDDAKSPFQAVILGTDAKDGSTIVKLPATGMKGVVDAMWVKLGPQVSGGSSPVKLGTAPNSDHVVEVGVLEEMAGGTGSQWRAGVWVSAFVAANTLGKDLTDFSFTAASPGYIDGASASGLMAGGFLATMTGEKIDSSVTMTGIINPDGTIGPVGGIPEKFKGSMEKGKKRLGYPIGMRWARSAENGKIVDLVELARQGGAEAVEIANVHDVYRLLTGKVLPEPLPVDIKEMTLDDETVTKLGAKYKEWQQRLATEWSALLELDQAGRLPTMLVTMGKLAQERAAEAEKYHKQGLVAVAYIKMLSAWVYAASATDTYDVLTRVQAGDINGAVSTLGALDALDETTLEVFEKIGTVKPSTLGGHLLMLGAFQAALRGWGFKVFASSSVAQTRQFLRMLASTDRAMLASPGVADKIVQQVAPTVLHIGKTVADTIVASQKLELESEKSVDYICSVSNVKRLSTSFASAGVAGVNYFETLLVEPMAKNGGVPIDSARNRVSMIEPDYLTAYMLTKIDRSEGVLSKLKSDWGENSVQWNLMLLAGNELAYLKSAELVAKYYSLNVK